MEVGKVKSKNLSSHRFIPLPPVVAAWIEKLITVAQPGDALVHGVGPQAKRAGYDPRDFSEALGYIMVSAGVRRLPPKCLRKSFATWAIDADINPLHVEAWIGHRSALVSLITGRHYLARVAVQKLLPSSQKMDGVIRSAMDGARLNLQQLSTNKAKR